MAGMCWRKNSDKTAENQVDMPYGTVESMLEGQQRSPQLVCTSGDSATAVKHQQRAGIKRNQNKLTTAWSDTAELGHLDARGFRWCCVQPQFEVWHLRRS